ncbi:hypothetical protein ADK60_24465 [Streptomyces sp. XY431]|nr:hypothetical protein [Streptomyces sp. XY431]KOV22888.1 hypothetical protein ADK60_24465 [Streptomyces sp. XY431]
MSKPLARRATACPIRPIPSTPSWVPESSRPSMKVGAQAHGSPERSSRSPSPSRRVAARSRAHAMSAVAAVSTPGVLVTVMPRSVQAATSTLW